MHLTNEKAEFRKPETAAFVLSLPRMIPHLPNKVKHILKENERTEILRHGNGKSATDGTEADGERKAERRQKQEEQK